MSTTEHTKFQVWHVFPLKMLCISTQKIIHSFFYCSKERVAGKRVASNHQNLWFAFCSSPHAASGRRRHLFCSGTPSRCSLRFAFRGLCVTRFLMVELPASELSSDQSLNIHTPPIRTSIPCLNLISAVIKLS